MNDSNNALEIWQQKVIEIFFSTRDDLSKRFGINIMLPNFEISPELNSSLGEWNPTRRTIRLATKLFLSQPYSVIKETLKHEIAHQIVSEVYKIDGRGISHGEAFANACRMLEISPERTLNESEWRRQKHLDPVVSKVGKIIDKAHCSAATEEEAEVFLQKAQELMVKYNLSQCQLNQDCRVFIRRPVGELYKKTPSYIFDICRLLEEHYFVHYIKTYVSALDEKDRIIDNKYLYYIELFGEPSNVEIASYIFTVLMMQCNNLWEAFKKEMKRCGHSIRGRYTKGSYIRGIIAGYQSKLDAQKNVLSQKNSQYQALIHIGDPLLKEMYHKEYPSLRQTKTRYTQDSGYDHGFQKGKNLSISTPLGQTQKRGKLIR